MQTKQAFLIAEEVLRDLLAKGAIKEYCICGSIRRGKPEVHDADLLIEPAVDDSALNEALLPYSKGEYEACGPKIKRFFYKGLKIDILCCREPRYWGAMQLFRTGNGDFNVVLRVIAKKRGLKMNECGLYDRETNKRARLFTEASLLKRLGYKFIPPEDRTPEGMKAYKI